MALAEQLEVEWLTAMQFVVERALDESLSDWEEIGATEVTGICADAYAGASSCIDWHLSRSPCRAAGRDSNHVLG